VCRTTTAVDGAGWIAFSTFRKKPQVKAQLTYYLPEKGGSHDFKFGFESLNDSYRYGHNGKSGPIRYSYAGSDASGSPDRIRFIDTGDPATYGTDWTVGPNLDLHYSGYAQDRWAPNNRLAISLGVRMDYQRMGYGDAIRKPLITDLLPDGSRIFPVSTTVAAHTFFANTNVAPRLGLTYDVTGKGRTVLKAFYGRYYNNLADGFSAVNPGGIYRYDTVEFAYNKHLRTNFFVQASADYQWRDDFRSALANPLDRSTSPLSADPIGINFQLTPNPAVPNRQKTSTYHVQFLGRYTLPYEVGFSANYRYQSGFPYSRVVPDCSCLNLSNFGADFFVEPLSNNRSDNVGLLNCRLDKGVKIGRSEMSAMLDIYNVTNADPVTSFNLNTGAAYKRVIAVLDPRVFQMGFR